MNGKQLYEMFREPYMNYMPSWDALTRATQAAWDVFAKKIKVTVKK